jgi:hypothetical protein
MDVRGERNGRGIGWAFAGVVIDDPCRAAFAKVVRGGKRGSAVAFLEAALAGFASLGVKVERSMTGNGAGYRPAALSGSCSTTRA